MAGKRGKTSPDAGKRGKTSPDAGKTSPDAGKKKTKKKNAGKHLKMIRREVMAGKRGQTLGGLMFDDLKQNRRGLIVSKKQQRAGSLAPWPNAVRSARTALHIHGFVPIKRGTRLYRKAMQFMPGVKRMLAAWRAERFSVFD